MFLDFSERYSFQNFPKHGQDLDNEKALTFENGNFITEDGRSIAIKMRIVSDGFAADCWSSTDDAQAFLDDAMGWLNTEHGLCLPDDRIAKKTYLSQLIVTTSKKLASISQNLEAFSSVLSKKAIEAKEADSEFSLGSVGCWSNDPAKKLICRFENQVGTKPSEKRFFTSGPFSTKLHVQLLEEFERILG